MVRFPSQMAYKKMNTMRAPLKQDFAVLVD